jgi:hypothetical protein
MYLERCTDPIYENEKRQFPIQKTCLSQMIFARQLPHIIKYVKLIQQQIAT